MIITNLSLSAPIIYELDMGRLYFYDDFVITEFGEGIILGEEFVIEMLSLINKHFGNDKPYGLVSHRLYSYSVNISELIPLSRKFGNFVVNAVVEYSEMTLGSFELEKRVLGFNGEKFLDMEVAIKWTIDKVLLAKKELGLI